MMETAMLLSASNKTVDKLVILAGGDLDLVQTAIKAAALRGMVQHGKYEAELTDVVSYIVAKTRQPS
jgi:hypothetical protein